MNTKTIIDLTGIPSIYEHHARNIVRYQGGNLSRVEFTIEHNTNNISVSVLNPITDDVTILAPIPTDKITPSECFLRLMMTLTQLRSEGASSFHIIFIRPLFDGSGSRHSPTTIGFKILADYINSRSDVQKVTLMGPHSSHSECMLSPPRRVIQHHNIVDLGVAMENTSPDDVVVISPDIGGFYNAHGFASKYSSLPPGIINYDVQSTVDLTNKTVIIFDDMVITGKKMMATYNIISQMDPARIVIAVTHVMSNLAVTVLKEILNDPRVYVYTAYTGEYLLSHERCMISDIHIHLLEAYTGKYERDHRS